MIWFFKFSPDLGRGLAVKRWCAGICKKMESPVSAWSWAILLTEEVAPNLFACVSVKFPVDGAVCAGIFLE